MGRKGTGPGVQETALLKPGEIQMMTFVSDALPNPNHNPNPNRFLRKRNYKSHSVRCALSHAKTLLSRVERPKVTCTNRGPPLWLVSTWHYKANMRASRGKSGGDNVIRLRKAYHFRYALRLPDWVAELSRWGTPTLAYLFPKEALEPPAFG